MKHVFAALAALWASAAQAQSCTVVPLSPMTGDGAVSGYVLDGRPLCYFVDRTQVRGTARLVSDNACFTADGGGDCGESHTFHSGDGGVRFFVQQDHLRATHAYFTLQVTLE